jgi:L,D-peptidoglycan transpeptidase YkuD (ErfK/YbiS/YcfS/YnhG family)
MVRKAESVSVVLAGTILAVAAANTSARPALSGTGSAPAADRSFVASMSFAVGSSSVRELADKSAVSQLITVRPASRAATYATLRAYHVANGKRVLVFGPWTARVGYNGIAAPGRKREGDGRTPSGTYGFSFFFGVSPSPGVAFRYRHAYPYDYWDDDPASARYNEWVDARAVNPGENPERMHDVPAYDYAAVIAYNTARTPGLGSAIFLHVGTGTATAGCVSLPRSELVKVLRWLSPADNPRISISAA